jgi:hypothetical protein
MEINRIGGIGSIAAALCGFGGFRHPDSAVHPKAPRPAKTAKS